MSFGNNKKLATTSSRVVQQSAQRQELARQFNDDRATFQSDCLFQMTKYNWYSKLKVPKLFQLVVDGHWDRVPHRTKTHPREAMFVHAYVPNDTALHRMLFARKKNDHNDASKDNDNTNANMLDEMNDLRLTAIRALLKANPHAISTPDHIGQTPLHLACQEYVALGTAKLMLEEYMLIYRPMLDGAATIQDDVHGHTPLHCLVLSMIGNNNEMIDSSSLRLVELLIQNFPACLDMRDRHGKTALDYCAVTEAESKNQDQELLVGILEQRQSSVSSS